MLAITAHCLLRTNGDGRDTEKLLWIENRRNRCCVKSIRYQGFYWSAKAIKHCNQPLNKSKVSPESSWIQRPVLKLSRPLTFPPTPPSLGRWLWAEWHSWTTRGGSWEIPPELHNKSHAEQRYSQPRHIYSHLYGHAEGQPCQRRLQKWSVTGFGVTPTEGQDSWSGRVSRTEHAQCLMNVSGVSCMSEHAWLLSWVKTSTLKISHDSNIVSSYVRRYSIKYNVYIFRCVDCSAAGKDYYCWFISLYLLFCQ